MDNKGCNDLSKDEFPKSICERFNSDVELLEFWKEDLMIRIDSSED